jgi:hypothetical protein
VIPGVPAEATKSALGGGEDERRGVGNTTDNTTAMVLKMCGLFDDDGARVPARKPHHLKKVPVVGRRKIKCRAAL